MINKFLSQKSKYSIYHSNIDSRMCLSIQKKEQVVFLKCPKVVYVLSEVNQNILRSSININKTLSSIDQQKIHTSFNNKFDKRNKVPLKQGDTVEARKHKVKFKKKTRSKIGLNKDDLFFVKNSNEVLNEDSLDVSIIKQPKYSKHKKKVKLKQNSLESSIDNRNELSSCNEISKNIAIDSPLTIQELANKLKIPEAEIITWLFLKGISVTINQVIDISMATEVAIHYNFNIINSVSSSNLNSKKTYTINSSLKSTKRPPVITILGHVDHGKTTLLDTIQSTNLVKQEAGGITQAIAGYEVNWSYGSSVEKLIFLDTPGHEAFTGMRLRGAQVTDIALLVVAADDGLKPQTIEAIKHIKANKLPCIVAINKIDKNNINILKIKGELAEYSILGEDCGGDTSIIEISALTGKNIDILLSSICRLSKLQALKAIPTQLAEGTILEAHLDKTKGPVANIIVQNGTLKIGDIIVSNNIYGRVKAIINSLTIKISQAGPSSIVEIWGFSSVPQAGATFHIAENEKQARQLIAKNKNIRDSYSTSKLLNSRVTLDTYNKTLNLKQLNLIIKADMQGSLEAIIHSCSQIPQEKVQINIISASSGNISDTDINLAMTSNSLVIAFNVNIPTNIYNIVQRLQVKLCNFTVIYDLLDYVKSYMLGLIEPEYEKNLIGTATVQTVFDVYKGSVAGCLVNTGKLQKNATIIVYRYDKIIYNGFLSSLKRVKDDVHEVHASNECGVMCNDYHSWQKQDIIKAYELQEKKKVL